MRRQLGATPANPTDTATKGYVDASRFNPATLCPVNAYQGIYQASGATYLANLFSTLTFSPFVIPAAATFSQISMEVRTAGSTGAAVRLGIYASNASNLPATLVVDAGAVAATTAGIKSITINQTLALGVYWVAMCTQGAPATLPQTYGVGCSFPAGGNTVANTIENASLGVVQGPTVASGNLPASVTPVLIQSSAPSTYGFALLRSA